MRPQTTLALIILAAACSGSTTPTTTASGSAATNTSDALTTSSTPDQGTAPIVVVTSDGNVVVVDEAGERLAALTEDAGFGRVYRQPVWSPDGRRLAWATVDASTDPPAGSVAVADSDGSNRFDVQAVGPPFYLLWDPTSQRIGYLASPPGGAIRLGMVDVASATATTIAGGQPFYFDWRPDGEELIAHIGVDRLERLGLDGATNSIAAAPGPFQAPSWNDDDRIVFTEPRDGGGVLVSSRSDGSDRRELVTYRGFMYFAASESRIAYQVVGATPDAVEAMVLRVATDAVAQANPQSLSIVDGATGAIEDLGQNTAGFFWSPTGTKLLFLTLEALDDEAWFHWNVWDGSDILTFPRFRPTIEFGRDYVPFFDQYGHSVRLWNPSGTAFVYAGQAEDGSDGVWIQDVVRDASPRRIGEGVVAFWAPQP